MKEMAPYPMSTLARLSLWVPAVRMDEFEAAYETRLAPLLKKYGLVESAQRGRKTTAEVFSRLFEMETPAAVVAREQALQQDLAWQEVLGELGRAFGQSSRRGEGEKQGSGLGLAIVRKSVELLGGTISVESQVGKGTRFTLRIRDYQGLSFRNSSRVFPDV